MKLLGEAGGWLREATCYESALEVYSILEIVFKVIYVFYGKNMFFNCLSIFFIHLPSSSTPTIIVNC